MKEVTIYTDGSCRKNPGGAGGYGAVLLYENQMMEISEGFPSTTNNIMEMMAAIVGLDALTEKCKVNLYSDSAYLVNAFNHPWLKKWQRNGWQSTSGPVKNKELWEKLLVLTTMHEVTFIKVKGHADNQYNNRCDELATTESAKFKGGN